MDFVFYCLSCQGPLIARTTLRGTRVQCAHCRGGIEASAGRTITETVVSALLDAPLPAAHRILRRVRPAVCYHSASASHSPARQARIVRVPRNVTPPL
jgi:hypothetical protein